MRLSKRILIFAAGFALLFAALQYVFLFRWAPSEDSRTTDQQFEALPEGTVDVLFFGTSETHNAIAPAVIYEQTGITSYNMATSWGSASTVYYRLLYALKHQMPKVAVCDFRGLFEHKIDEADCVRTYENFLDRDLRRDFLDAACADDPELDRMEFYVPIHRYHSLWHDMTYANLLPRGYLNKDRLPAYLMGGYLDTDIPYHGTYDSITPDLWTDKGYNDSLSGISCAHYQNFIDVCRENGITVVFIGLPLMYDPAYEIVVEDLRHNYLTGQGVFYYELNSYDICQEIGLVLKEDYVDNSHCTAAGAAKVSAYVAGLLADPYYGLTDHRGEASYEAWENAAAEYHRSLD